MIIAPHRTKIIATLGPAVSDEKVLKEFLTEGVNITRLNFAHGEFETRDRFVKLVRDTAREIGRPIGIFQDLPGPKLRVGPLKGGQLSLSKGEEVFLITKQKHGFGKRIFINYPRLLKEVKVGHAVYFADGLIRLKVTKVRRKDIICRVTNGGIVSPGNGVNLPNTSISLKAFTSADEKYLEWGLKKKVDFVGVSFVGSAADIARVRKFCLKRKQKPFLVAKIERSQALENLEEIVNEADGIMVARGDLGVEIPFSQIPDLQRKIVQAAHRQGKPVIVATQVMESMTQNPRPTRAEATDIANAIREEADAIMLSGETAVGKYPKETVAALREVARAAESPRNEFSLVEGSHLNFSDTIAHEACHVARRIKAKLIIIPTVSGATAARVSRFRPSMPVLALSNDRRIRRRMTMFWGIQTVPIPQKPNFNNAFSVVRKHLKKLKLVKNKDKVLVVSGAPGLPKGETGMIQVVEI